MSRAGSSFAHVLILFCLASTGSLVALPLTNETKALQTRVGALETEVEMLRQQISSQADSNESIQAEVKQLLRASNEAMKDSLLRTKEGQESLKKGQEKGLEKISQDLKTVKNHANELTNSLHELSQRVQALIDNDKTRLKQIQDLETALRALTLALQPKKTAPVSTDGTIHTVSSGESLEKIAKMYKMSVSELKELNNLTSNTIRIGQQLHVANALQATSNQTTVNQSKNHND